MTARVLASKLAPEPSSLVSAAIKEHIDDLLIKAQTRLQQDNARLARLQGRKMRKQGVSSLPGEKR
jgi:hypothetical protein